MLTESRYILSNYVHKTNFGGAWGRFVPLFFVFERYAIDLTMWFYRIPKEIRLRSADDDQNNQVATVVQVLGVMMSLL